MNTTHKTLTSILILGLSLTATRAGEVEPIEPEFTDEVKEQLANGETAVFYPKALPPSGGFLAAAIHIDATQEEAWRIVSSPDASRRI